MRVFYASSFHVRHTVYIESIRCAYKLDEYVVHITLNVYVQPLHSVYTLNVVKHISTMLYVEYYLRQRLLCFGKLFRHFLP